MRAPGDGSPVAGPERMWERQRARGPLADAWWAMAGGRPGRRVADVGCGPGWFALRYAAMTGPTGHVHAVDADAEAVESLRRRLDPAHHAHVTTEVLDVARHPLPDLAFDALLVTDVLHHADPRAVLRSLRRTPARLVVAEFHPDGPGEVGPPVGMRLAPSDLLAALHEAGWEVREIARQPFEHYAVAATPAP